MNTAKVRRARASFRVGEETQVVDQRLDLERSLDRELFHVGFASESLDGAIVNWIREHVLSPNVVTETLRYVRQLFGARTQTADVELPQLRQDAER